MLTAGSVAVPVIAHAGCPVVVVRHREHAAVPSPAMVVGVDGTPDSTAALAYAFEAASLRDATVSAMWACPIPTAPVSARAVESATRNARETLDGMLAEWSAKYPDVRTRRLVTFDHPVRMLSEASETALAVVVGTRGLGGFRGMLFGAASKGLVHQAQCPLVIIPRSTDRG